MAKKKTVGSEPPAETTPATPRRRISSTSPRRRAVSTSAAAAEPVSAAPVERDQAADMGAPDASSEDIPVLHQPSYHEIAEAAYHRFLQRGGSHGRDFDDWLEAERGLRARG